MSNEPSPSSETPPESLSFEDALGELERLVRRLEDGQAKLDDALAAYERGIRLKRHCESKLREAEARIEQIALNENGTVTTSPLPPPT